MFLIKTINFQMLILYYRYIYIIQTQITFYLLIYRIRFYIYLFIIF